MTSDWPHFCFNYIDKTSEDIYYEKRKVFESTVCVSNLKNDLSQDSLPKRAYHLLIPRPKP